MSISAIVMLIVAILIIWGGLGLAMLPLFIAAEDLAAGRLVEALPQERPLDDLIYAMYSRAATLSPKVKLFVQFLQQALGSPPWGVR